jgi:DNA polymerase III delta prime subunit
LKDYTNELGKQHTIPVELTNKNKTLELMDRNRTLELSDGSEQPNSAEPTDSNETLELSNGSKQPNYGIRELNLWLQQSGFSPIKFVLIENIQRMSDSAMNAFLKTSEEPLPNRFIIATVPHTSQVFDTILSRSVTLHFDPLSEKEMQEFAKENAVAADDKALREILIAMAMGKP